jgi:hypothetical protein
MNDKPSVLTCEATHYDGAENAVGCHGDMTYDIAATHQPSRPRHGDTWPQVSMSVGVMPEQREEAMKEASAAGVPTHFNENGDAVFTSQKHRRAYCKALGFRDNDAGYGDWSGE